jgi:hypothetical protein
MLKKRGSSLNKHIVAGGVEKLLPCAFMAPGFGPDMKGDAGSIVIFFARPLGEHS